MGKRKTTDDDIKRLAERVFRQSPHMQDEDDFNNAFQKYMDVDLTAGQEKLKKQVFRAVTERHSSILTAGKPKASKKAMQRKAERRREVRAFQNSFDVAGRVGGKVAFLRKTTDRRGHTHYRDSKGRFGTTKSKGQSWSNRHTKVTRV